jgi:hypothetical protein
VTSVSLEDPTNPTPRLSAGNNLTAWHPRIGKKNARLLGRDSSEVSEAGYDANSGEGDGIW